MIIKLLIQSSNKIYFLNANEPNLLKYIDMFFMDLTQAAKNVARFMVRINLKAYYLGVHKHNGSRILMNLNFKISSLVFFAKFSLLISSQR